MTTDEIKGLLTDQTIDSIEELYQFGWMLMSECLDRAKQLDLKATSLTGYCGVIIALLVSAFAGEANGRDGLSLVILGGLFIVVAGALSLRVLWVREYHWFSDKDWFAPSVITKPNRLRQAHLLTMHSYKQRHEAVNRERSGLLKKA